VLAGLVDGAGRSLEGRRPASKPMFRLRSFINLIPDEILDILLNHCLYSM
jgi:hypothetical protein